MDIIILAVVIYGIYKAVKWLNSSDEKQTAEKAEELKNNDNIRTIIKHDVDVVEALSKLANNLDNGSQSSVSSVFIDNSNPEGQFFLKAYLADDDELLRMALVYRSEITGIHMNDSIKDFNERIEDYKQRIKFQEDLYRNTAFSGLTDSEFHWLEDAEFVIDNEIFTGGDVYRFEKRFGAPCQPADKNGLVKLYVDTIHQRLPNADITWGRLLTSVTFKGSGKVVYKNE